MIAETCFALLVYSSPYGIGSMHTKGFATKEACARFKRELDRRVVDGKDIKARCYDSFSGKELNSDLDGDEK
jgi:hypothetical protein